MGACRKCCQDGGVPWNCARSQQARLELESHNMENPDCISQSKEPMLNRSVCQYIAKLESRHGKTNENHGLQAFSCMHMC